jgi:hypothetical protein
MATNKKAPITVAPQNEGSPYDDYSGRSYLRSRKPLKAATEQIRCRHRCCMEMESRIHFRAISEPHFTTTWPVIFGWTEQ